ncbi:hypothetical protein V8F33_013365 [Rhypophila sp. PSN 637]
MSEPSPEMGHFEFQYPTFQLEIDAVNLYHPCLQSQIDLTADTDSPGRPDLAAQAREKGNALYKKGKLEQAETAYTLASSLAPNDPAPISNLSAVKFEMGYFAQAVKLSVKALSLSQDSPQDKRDRLLIRLAKSYLDQKVDPARERVNIVKHLQRYRPSLQDVAEYYPVGHDVPDSLLDEPLFKRLGLSIEGTKVVSKTNTENTDVSFLFCGIGDGRHLFATMIASGGASRHSFKFLKALHITVLDLKPPALAKLLILLDLFAQYHASRKSNEDEKVRLNLIYAMAYIFITIIYPPFVHDLVQQSLGRLIDAMEAGTPVCSWVYVPEPSRAPILHYLKQWQGPAVEAYSNNKRLRDLSARQIAMSEQAEAEMVMRFGGHPLQDEDLFPKGCEEDRTLVKKLNILAPPKAFDSGDGPELRKLLDSVRGNSKKTAAKSLDDYISATWKTNVTQLDLDWERQWKEDGSPFSNPDEMHSGIWFHPIQVAAAVSRDVQSFKGTRYNTISRLAGFFAESAETALELVGSAPMVIEVICGEVAEVMERLQYDCYEGRAVGPDPSKFPKTFDRIHLSNIPDNVGGPLNPFLFARPLLKPLPDVSVWYNNLLNCSSFTDMDQFHAEYTLLPSESLISKQFQLKRQSSHLDVQNFLQVGYMYWDLVHPTGSPLPFEKLLMSRPQLEKWLHAWFLKICLSYPRGQRDGYAIHSPFNLTVLLRLMAHLHEVTGYPAHWLARILRALCNDSLTTTARSSVRLITTVADLNKTYLPKKMNISPYNAELTTLVELWRPLFKFGFALPQEQTVSPQDVVECKVLFRGGFKGDDGLRMSRFMILLWNKSLLGTPPVTLRGLLSGEDANWAKILEKKGMHVVSIFAYSVAAQTASFWLRSDVVDRVIEESANTKGDGWVVYIWRTDSCAAQSKAVKVKDCLVKGRKWTDL